MKAWKSTPKLYDLNSEMSYGINSDGNSEALALLGEEIGLALEFKRVGPLLRYLPPVAVDALDAALAAGDAVLSGDELTVSVEVLAGEEQLAGLGVVNLEGERAEAGDGGSGIGDGKGRIDD